MGLLQSLRRPHPLHGEVSVRAHLGIAPNIPGFFGTIKVVNPATVGPFLMNLYNYAWLVGFAVAFFAYGGFMTVAGKIKLAK